MCDRIVCSLLCFLMVLIAGCSSAPLASSVGYYGQTPGRQEVKGSYGQSLQTFVVEHDTEDVRKAVITAAGINGLTFDVVKDNMLSGSAQWVPPGFTGGCAPSQVYAVYLNEAGKRKTSVTIVADHLSFCAAGTNSQLLLVQRLVSATNSVLATY
jgi:hypothetical protein